MNRKGFAPLIIVLILGVLIIGSGVWYWKQQSVSTSPQPQTALSTETTAATSTSATQPPSIPSSSISTDTSNWKTYRDPSNGFEFHFPSDWKIESTSSSEISLKPTLENQPDISVHLSSGPGIPFTCPFSTHEIECKTLQNKEGSSFIREISTGQLNLDRQQQLNGFFESKNLNIEFITILTDKRGNVDPLSLNSTKVFDSILSTFKFTSKTIISSPEPGVSGPTSLTTSQVGTWTVTVPNPRNEKLSYSVYWGDTAPGMAEIPWFTSPVFQKSYLVPGIYKIKFTVKNDAGPIAELGSSVKVSEPTSACSDENCFDKSFAACSANATFVDTSSSYGSLQYAIVGKTTGGCTVNQKILSYPIPDFVGLEMDCTMNNMESFTLAKKSLSDQLANPTIAPCTGTFLQALINLSNVSKAH